MGDFSGWTWVTLCGSDVTTAWGGWVILLCWPFLSCISPMFFFPVADSGEGYGAIALPGVTKFWSIFHLPWSWKVGRVSVEMCTTEVQLYQRGFFFFFFFFFFFCARVQILHFDLFCAPSFVELEVRCASTKPQDTMRIVHCILLFSTKTHSNDVVAKVTVNINAVHVSVATVIPVFRRPWQHENKLLPSNGNSQQQSPRQLSFLSVSFCGQTRPLISVLLRPRFDDKNDNKDGSNVAHTDRTAECRVA